MAPNCSYSCQAIFITMLTILTFVISMEFDSSDEFSIVSYDGDLFQGDYTPPAPPPPAPFPHPPSFSCENDLKGIGSLNSICELNSSLTFRDDVYIEGNGSLYILPGEILSCPVLGCSIQINVTREFSLGVDSMIV